MTAGSGIEEQPGSFSVAFRPRTSEQRHERSHRRVTYTVTASQDQSGKQVQPQQPQPVSAEPTNVPHFKEGAATVIVTAATPTAGLHTGPLLPAPADVGMLLREGCMYEPTAIAGNTKVCVWCVCVCVCVCVCMCGCVCVCVSLSQKT
jgi:hypothetical protein